MSNTNDLISRQAAFKDIADLMLSPWFCDKNGFCYRKEAVEIVRDLVIKRLPSAQPERKKGEWVKTIKHYKDDNMEFDFYAIKCSVCGLPPEKSYHLTDYCPNCGSYNGGEPNVDE
jgi:hypothetical protein